MNEINDTQVKEKKPSDTLGFRSGKTWKKVVAVIYYVFVGLSTASGYFNGGYGWYSALFNYLCLMYPVEFVNQITGKPGIVNKWAKGKGVFAKILSIIFYFVYDCVFFYIFIYGGRYVYVKFFIN